MTRDDIEHMVREAGIKTGFVLHMTKWDKATWLFMRRFAVLVAAAERERAIVIAKNMKEELEAKFEQTYMEGVIAGAAAEREACAKVCEEPGWNAAKWCADRIRARGKDA